MNRHERRAAKSSARAKGQAQTGNGIGDTVTQGIALINAGEYPQAEQIFRHLLKSAPDSVEAKHQLGTILARTGRAEEGIALLREATAAMPKESLYWSNLAAACYIAQDSKGAAEAARQAVALRPDYGLAWDNLGSALMDLGEFAEAIEAYRQAMRFGAGDLETQKRLSACYMGIEDYPSAVRVINSVLAGNAEDHEMLACLGSALIETKDFAGARDALAKAAAIAPDYFPTAYHYGRVLRLSGDRVAALRWLRRATSSEPRNPVAWRDLAEASLEEGDLENAKVAIERAFALEPNAVSIRALRDRIVPPVAPQQPVLDFSNIGPFIPIELDAPRLETLQANPAAPATEPGVVDLSILKIGN
ncbi:tetratricopeptide repeat protein [Dongia sp.]|uniref:tetratricopeptide repeat protein n=1 Tax=Dongia sp. TaxID=1977262 RepID=UPI0035B3A8AF